jgi:hypothetical protein
MWLLCVEEREKSANEERRKGGDETRRNAPPTPRVGTVVARTDAELGVGNEAVPLLDLGELAIDSWEDDGSVRVSETVGCGRRDRETSWAPVRERKKEQRAWKREATWRWGRGNWRKSNEKKKRKRTTVRIKLSPLISALDVEVLTLESTRNLDVVRRPDHVGAGKSACVEKRKRSELATCKWARNGQEGARKRSAGKREDRSGEGLKKRTRKEK